MPKRRFAIKSEDSDSNITRDDVLLARGRLAGALQGIIEGSDEDSKESELSEEEEYKTVTSTSTSTSTATTSRNNLLKGRRKRQGVTECQQTYIMKLFDRSVDLAKFRENTPLYPVCRAWMANEPKLLKPKMRMKQEKDTPEEIEVEPPQRVDISQMEFDEKNITDVFSLPAPVGKPGSRIPPPLDFHLNRDKNNINLDYETNPAIDKDVLLADHMKQWNKVKSHWQKHAFENEKRYNPSTKILTAIYNKAQENMDY